MIDWNDLDINALDRFEEEAYNLCKFDNTYFDCEERLCYKCPLCPLDSVTFETIPPEALYRIYQLFLRLHKAHDIEDLKNM